MSALPSPLMSPAPTPCAGHGPGPETLTEIHGPSGFAGSGCENDTPAPLLLMTSGFPSPSTSRYAVTSPPPSMPVDIAIPAPQFLAGIDVQRAAHQHVWPAVAGPVERVLQSRLLGYGLLGFHVWVSAISRETVKSGPRKYHGPATISRCRRD